MKKIHGRLLQQIAKLASEGKFGEAAHSASQEYSQIPIGIPTMLKYISDFYEKNNSTNQEIARTKDYFCQMLIMLYRETKKLNPSLSTAFISSFIEDFPNVDGSLLLPRWSSLAQASLAFKKVATSEDSLLIWQQASRLFQAYNEFLNGLLGFLIVAWRCVKDKEINPNVFNSSYAVKARQFSELTDGENGVFYLFHRIIKPKMRNAIAHETAWLDMDAGKVRYTEGSQQRIEYEMDLIEFLSLTTLGSQVGSAYIAAIAAVIVLEEGNEKEKPFLPHHLIKLFEH